MELTVESINEIGFRGAWYPGEGYCASIGEYGTDNYYSIILPHNLLKLPNRETIFVESIEKLKEIIANHT